MSEYWDIPMYMVFRRHVLVDGMSPEPCLVLTERTYIPAYIKRKGESGQDW